MNGLVNSVNSKKKYGHTAIANILNSDVAAFYGMKTMRINETIKNNPDKLSEGYIFELSREDKKKVIKNFD